MIINNKKYNIMDSIVTDELKPAFNNNNIAIVFASDNNYVKYLSVAIISLTDNMSKDYNYDIVILEDKIKDKSKWLLLEQVKDFKNVSLRFIDINKYFKNNEDIKFKGETRHLTRSTYSRLFIPDIFKHYNKVIYLDVDILINDNLIELYNTDSENYLIVGVKHTNSYSFKLEYITKTKGEGIEKKVLNIDNYIEDSHINAGVILYNIKSCNEYDFLNKCLEFIKNHDSLPFQDQDVLNGVCSGKIKCISFEYNFCFEDIGDTSNFSQELIDELNKKIKIFHFYGLKPWISGGFNGWSYQKWIKTSFKSPFFKGKIQRLFKAKIDLIRYEICNKMYISKRRTNKYKSKIENAKNLIKFIKNIE